MDIKLDVNKALEEIANGLGVAVEKLYPILYKQAIIDGITNLIWVALIIIGTILFSKYAKFAINRVHKGIQNNEMYTYSKTDWSDYPLYVLSIVLGVIACIIFIIIAMVLVENSITALFNTEYYMIEEILRKVTK